MKSIIIILIILVCNQIIGQNLVINGNIEADSCKAHWGTLEIDGWERHKSANHIHYSCGYISEFTQYWLPYEGRGCLGIYTGGYHVNFGDTIFARGYVIGSLEEAMVKDKEYYVSFWVKPTGYGDAIWNYSTSDQISLVFQQNSDQFNSFDKNGDYIKYFHFEPDITNPHGMLYNFDEYIQIEACYRATGNENSFMLGNFLELGKTALDTLRKDREENAGNGWFSHKSYILIDKVEIYELPSFFTSDTTLCNGAILTMDNSILEFDEVYINDILVEDSFTINQAGTYNLIGYKGSCKKEISLNVDFVSCINCNYYVSNIIAPDGLRPNNRSLISSDCDFNIVSARIFDRWGNLIYNSESTFEWDGSVSESETACGVYTYDIVLEVNNTEGVYRDRISGTITVLR